MSTEGRLAHFMLEILDSHCAIRFNESVSHSVVSASLQPHGV